MTRTGKIARLPREIREQLNRRLQDGETGIRLVEWLNSMSETKKVLAADFGGRDINEQNLSEWKQGGHQDWLARQETLACARDVAADAGELAEVAEGSLANHLATVLSARYASLVSGWNGEMDDEFRRKARALRVLCQDIVELRRGDHYAERLRLDLERFAEANKEDQLRALEVCLDETKQWPDVQQAFRDAFALLKQQKRGKLSTGQPAPGPPQSRSDQTKSNQIKPNENTDSQPAGKTV
jgi:hypothetical protein